MQRSNPFGSSWHYCGTTRTVDDVDLSILCYLPTAIHMTSFKDLNVPKTFSFIMNYFSIKTSNSKRLYAYC
jgi:hypothetical protein